MQRRKVSRRLLGLMLIGLFLVAGIAVGVLQPLADAVGVVFRPFQVGLGDTAVTVGSWFQVIGQAGQLEAQNQQLRAQVASLQEQVSQEAEIKAQNNTLRAQLGVGPMPSKQLLAAEVVSYQPDNFRQFITIARGSSDGVKAGMAVVEKGALVGTIQSTTAHTAKVFLVIDPNFRIAALDQNQSDRPTGTIHGQIGNGLEMDEIAQTETINPGDTIVTSGLGGGVQSGLIIGHVQTVTKQDNGVFQTAQVTSTVQFSRLEIVYVELAGQ